MSASAKPFSSDIWQPLLQNAFHALQAGDYQGAVQFCQKILSENDAYAPAYAILGDVWRKLEKLENAEKFYGLAVKFAPDHLPFSIEYAKLLAQLERFDEATALLLALQKSSPDSPAMPMLLADVAMRQREFTRALEYLKLAQKKGAPALIEEQFATCYRELRDYATAEQHLQKLLDTSPQHVRALNMLATIHTESGKLDEAQAILDKILTIDPNYYQALIGRSTLHVHKKEFKEAHTKLEHALKQMPNHFRAYYSLGSLYFLQKQYDRAIHFLKDSVERNMSFLPAQQMLANALFNVNRKQEALPYIDAVLEKFPNYPAFQHIRAAILGETTEKAPEAYVKDLFDTYAEHFDQHLVEGLQYIVPQRLQTEFRSIREKLNDKRHNLSLLDLGCGTGLGAEVLLDATEFRVGVDLSAGMIQKADHKKIYNELHVADVVQFMKDSARHYEMIIATDVLVYIGALETFLSESMRILESGGYIAFSTEDNTVDTENYKILASGRYIHQPEYIKKLTAQHPLTLLSHTVFAGRHESGAPQPHSLYIYQKS